jgi:hypothetical protein
MINKVIHILLQTCSNGHMLTHSSKKPFECRFPSCGRSYCDARSLRRHHDNYHSRPSDLGGLVNRPSSTDGMLLALTGVNQSDRLAVCSASSLSPAGSETRDMCTVSTSSDSSGLFELAMLCRDNVHLISFFNIIWCKVLFTQMN